MFKHYIGIGLLLVVVFAISVLAFRETGSPVSQQALRFDEIRLANFNDIKYKIETYYQKNKSLPVSLSNLTMIPRNDPETKKPYVYDTTGKTSYKLCTDFSTDSSNKKSRRSAYYEEDVSHSVGYDCIEYKLPDWATKTQTSTPAPTAQITPKGYGYCINSDEDSADEISVKGSVRYGNENYQPGSGLLTYDYCRDNMLYEQRCKFVQSGTEAYYEIEEIQSSCPGGCVDGACKSP